ncbi:MAG TPA: VOC family protein, partial [Anaerolineales bacterium]|nr:VOC family protein [Anaerolineales bacterium]
MVLNGIHHVTAVSARIGQNVDFYTNLLGLRLVKKSVNQDDVSAYHLFYADKAGSPGTDMTFFDWPNIGPDRRGADSIATTAFRVDGRAA